MSLQTVAKRLERQGRNGDTMLMHVNPTELQILESMLGKTTINPETGLPEAFNWKALLSVLVGVVNPIAGIALGTGFALTRKKKGDEFKPSEAGKYQDERTAQRVKDQHSFPNPTMLQSISDQVPGQNPVPVDPLGRMHNWYNPPKFAQGGQVSEADAKKTVLALLAQMQQGQQEPQQFAQGRMMRGPGTGLSDSIPADLGVGEYVVPADVVSMMGDGSSDAGGRTLDALVARVRMAKTGTKKQAGKLPLQRVLGMQHA